MKTINKIFGIGLIALIAMTCIGAVSAEPVERTVLGNAWIQDVGVTDDFDYFIYDGTEDAVSADGWLRESIGGSETAKASAMDDSQFFKSTPAPAPIHKHIAGVDNELTREQIDELIKQAGENQNIAGTEKVIVANGIGYYDDSGVEYRDTIKQSTGGITVDDWVVPSNEPNYEFNFYKNEIRGDFTGNYADGNGGAIYYTNGMTGQLDDGEGNLLTFVPDSSLNPPRPDINIPYYPTEQTDIVLP